MALTFCEEAEGRVSADRMDGERWQNRAKNAGLSQRQLAELLGFSPNTISRQLRGMWESGVPRHVIAAIVAWELMTPEQREDWLSVVERDSP